MSLDKKLGVIFDLDGTLVDSLRGIARALNESLQALGMPQHSEAKARTFIGNGMRTLLTRALPTGAAAESVLDRLALEFQKNYADAWRGDGTVVYDGVLGVLQELQRRGVPMAILSNKNHEFTLAIVASLLPQIKFVEVRGFQEGLPLKPDKECALALARKLNLAAADICFVGDTKVDVKTARNAAMTPLLVTWGYHYKEFDDEVAGAATLTRPQELLAYF